MAVANIFLVEAANLFCGDDDVNASNHLTLESIQLPMFEMVGIDNAPGGSVLAVSWTVPQISALTSTFNLKGADPSRLSLFGLGSKTRRKYTAYFVVRDKRTNKAMQGVATMEAVLRKISPSSFSRSAGMDHEYELAEIVSYSLTIDNKEIYFVDYFLSELRVNGVSETAESNRLLGVA